MKIKLTFRIEEDIAEIIRSKPNGTDYITELVKKDQQPVESTYKPQATNPQSIFDIVDAFKADKSIMQVFAAHLLPYVKESVLKQEKALQKLPPEPGQYAPKSSYKHMGSSPEQTIVPIDDWAK